jgi:NitT/TauT family transport system ATP-binding protein
VKVVGAEGAAVPAPADGGVLVSAWQISKWYDHMLVLDRVDLDIRDGEFVALLGPSGSGKSTLLRILTGLIPPSGGLVRYRGRVFHGPCPHAAMVFQTFALYPWLTVLENVEIGLKAQGLPLRARREKAQRLIELVGLDGFEDAYPKELSGGMRQRVGFARALAVEPELLCMDEPFSALDVLTAENLRSELLDLWAARRIPTRSILMVTHGVEEAVFMADRIVVLSRNPARVVANVRVELPRPRNRKDPAFLDLVDRVYRIVTEAGEQSPRQPAHTAARGAGAAAARPAGTEGPAAPPGPGEARPAATSGGPAEPAPSPAAVPGSGQRRRYLALAHASLVMLTGLLELVADRGGRDDLYHLGSELLLELDDLLPVTDAAQQLGLATVREGDLCLTELGQRFAEADVPERKRILAQQMQKLPICAVIRRVLEGKRNRTMPREFFVDLLARDFGEAEAQAQLDTAIAWGRYAELFAYDPASEEFYLEDEGGQAGDRTAGPSGPGAESPPPPGGGEG